MLEIGFRPQSDPEPRQEEHPEPVFLPSPEAEGYENMSILRREFFKQRNEYRKLLESYNELSSAFRTHLSQSMNDYFLQMLNDLKLERDSLKNINKYCMRQVYVLIEENYRLKSGGAKLKDHGMDIESVEDLVFQNFTMKQFLGKEYEQHAKWLESQLNQSKEVIKSQILVIQELKNEIENIKTYPSNIEFPEPPHFQVQYQLVKSLLSEVKKENHLLRSECTSLKENQAKLFEEISKLHQQLAETSGKIETDSKLKNLIQRENLYLNEITKEFDKINMKQVMRFTESNVFQQLQILENENDDLKKKLAETVHETRKSNKAGKEEMTKAEENRIKEIVIKEKIKIEKKDQEIGKLKDDIINSNKKCEEMQNIVNNLQKELGENLKSLKKVSDELEGVKKITSKRVAQLENMIAGKNEEITRLSTAQTNLPIEKVVCLLHKAFSIEINQRN
ncbi:hypothetical protein SteCoe_31721 [Stentor coeruleus]|uniref:Uncharacterized protein n=1 Tax=Stentor coeruleus TaxID=5963 RepID=A0A1R2B134_9CILI|nr:hypothetical protein SteCoe_31721 [Stentor coeruleus]